MKSVIKIVSTLLAAMLVFAMAGCSKPQPAPKPTGYPVSAVNVTLDQKPDRVVCLTAGAVDAVKYFTGESVLVGVCDDASVNNEIEKIGSTTDADIDKIISLSCDIVFSNEKLSEQDTQKLAVAGVKLAVIPVPVYFEDLQGYYTSFANLLLGTVDAPTRIQAAMDILSAPTLAETAFSALLMPTLDIVATPDTVMGQLVSCAGFKNAAQGCVDFVMSKEAISDAAPDVIFCGTGIKEKIMADSVLSKTPAALNDQIFEVDTNSLRLPGNRFAQIIADMKISSVAGGINNQSDISSSGE